MQKTHSHTGASSAHRWMICPGSVALSKKAPPKEASSYAVEGTGAHEFAELCITNSKDPHDYIGEETENGTEITQEMAEGVAMYKSYIEEIAASGRFIRLVEAKFDLSCIDIGLFGTADFVMMKSDMTELHVIDFKYGAGTPVDVVENKQLLYYTLGAIYYAHLVKKWLDDPVLFGWAQSLQKVVVHVVQPRCRHADGPVRSWEIPLDRLDRFADELKAASLGTRQKDAPLVTGTHCKFCPAMAICPALGAQMTELAVQDFSSLEEKKTLEFPAPESLTLNQVVKILSFSDLFSEWLKSVNQYAYQLAENGQKVPGYKLVKKKSKRIWKNEDEVVDVLGTILSDDDIWSKELKSPAQIEKVIGKKNVRLIEKFYHTPDNGTTLAPEHDSRPELRASLEDDFSTLK